MNLDLIQMSAVDKLSKLKAGALFMKMGTGKTKTAIDLCKSKIGHFDYIIWIAPASLINDNSYINEIRKWSVELFSIIKFYTIEGVSQSDSKYLKMRSFATKYKIFCVVDESLTIKNTESGRTKRLLGCSELFNFRLILNGTPVAQGLIDLYSQIQFISPKILNMTEAQFAHNFLQYKKDGYKPWKRWSKPENEQALIETIRPYIFDADLDINCSLNIENIKLKLSNIEQSDYHDFKIEYLSKNIELDFLALTQKFQSVYTCSESKLHWLESLNDSKYIIFVKFIHEIDAIKEKFKDTMEYSGREKCQIEDFKNNNSKFLVMTYGTGSKGLNLQFCNNIVFFSQTFNWADKEHGIYRCYRTRQANDVNIFNLQLNTGLEKLFLDSSKKKDDVAKNIKNFIEVKGIMSL